MKILFGIQTTGNGHLSRSQEVLPLLMQHAEVHVLLSGEEKPVQVNAHKVIRKKGLTYVFDNSGKISYTKTASNLSFLNFIKDVKSLDLSSYDLILNDFEPITAWAAKLNNRFCLALSHQASFLSEKTPRPNKRNEMVEMLIKYFAPCSAAIGFHFKQYDQFIEPPVIKSDVINLDVSNQDHYTVYLPAFSPEYLVKKFNNYADVEWQIFAPQVKMSYKTKNVRMNPTSKQGFLDSLKSSQGVITAGGFELCAETMYLEKKLFSIPVINQYEQICNAAALRKLGIPVSYSLEGSFDTKLEDWLNQTDVVTLERKANINSVIERVLQFGADTQLQEVA